MRPKLNTRTIHQELADIWIATDSQADVNYYYGGTRVVAPDTSEHEIEDTLGYLVVYESGLKNHLINNALAGGAADDFLDWMPAGFAESRVGGSRCIIRPRTSLVAKALSSPLHPEYRTVMSSILATIAEALNSDGGRVKLTPDFGKFSGAADILYEFTPHVLGICCNAGGCGGKSSYTTTSITTVLDALNITRDLDVDVTLIGSAGALGSETLPYFTEARFKHIAVCDLAYDDASAKQSPPPNTIHITSESRKFTDACMRRGGIIVATTLGGELENSNLLAIPSGTTLCLAHNMAIPPRSNGIRLIRTLTCQGCLVIPGQLLTLGGALTSRLEWFWRQAEPGRPFDKALAHSIVRSVSAFCVTKALADTAKNDTSPYEAMLAQAAAGPDTTSRRRIPFDSNTENRSPRSGQTRVAVMRRSA